MDEVDRKRYGLFFPHAMKRIAKRGGRNWTRPPQTTQAFGRKTVHLAVF
jgi:hypothetical protein